ncbi:class I SAM-dependent methyltransferase [Lysobacter humi (ex Lee et al. 2017)]
MDDLVRRLFARVRHTPLHPQWLTPRRSRQAADIARVARGLVLDIGCADRWAVTALPSGCDYVGLDYPATGGSLYGARPDVYADAAGLPFRDRTVDTVLLLEVLEHLPEPAATMREIARVLSDGGRVVLSLPLLYPIHDAPYDFQRLTEHGLRRLLGSTGFEIEDLRPSTNAFESASLVMNLVIAGTALESIRRRSLMTLVALPLCSLVPLFNLAGRLLGCLLPNWGAATGGYHVVARRA